ncbi:hypothetical protein PAPYR_11228 [Paratrimastix pyriformis]|uniref:TLDc domain-containing protein n=1 Tax=Paratrimastix pyriformis TaxID=342808 RepID=A0ABQ8U453_9EUKA|nr:hypothetical protein PAPYR_13374 [Paratrimastix pyriformis]KAJ4454134.1 hypothetical protein PAPYR_11228 [Paratrimastix pyriformis]
MMESEDHAINKSKMKEYDMKNDGENQASELAAIEKARTVLNETSEASLAAIESATEGLIGAVKQRRNSLVEAVHETQRQLLNEFEAHKDMLEKTTASPEFRWIIPWRGSTLVFRSDPDKLVKHIMNWGAVGIEDDCGLCRLPLEVLGEIVQLLPISSLLALRQTCRFFASFFNGPFPIWEMAYRRDFGEAAKGDLTWVEAYRKAFHALPTNIPLNPSEASHLQRWFGSLPRCNHLLYRATRDGWAPAIFHVKCDGKGPTMTLIQTNTNHIFGGFTSVSWSSPIYPRPCADRTAFLFSLRRGVDGGGDGGPPLRLDQWQNPDFAVRHDSQYGPSFGFNDLCTLGSTLINLRAWTYGPQPSIPASDGMYRYLAGVPGDQARLVELEVFGVSPGD